MMKRIISKEPVVIPDGHGGILETVYVEVPAMQNEETGEVFLGDDASSPQGRGRTSDHR